MAKFSRFLSSYYVVGCDMSKRGQNPGPSETRSFSLWCFIFTLKFQRAYAEAALSL